MGSPRWKESVEETLGRRRSPQCPMQPDTRSLVASFSAASDPMQLPASPDAALRP